MLTKVFTFHEIFLLKGIRTFFIFGKKILILRVAEYNFGTLHNWERYAFLHSCEISVVSIVWKAHRPSFYLMRHPCHLTNLDKLSETFHFNIFCLNNLNRLKKNVPLFL